MLKEINAILKIADKLKEAIERTDLKDKWQKEKKISGRLIIEGYQIDFLIKEADKHD
ncbi:MAG: hypothetical protein QW540_11125 [Archaeoglobaceae archaeon]